MFFPCLSLPFAVFRCVPTVLIAAQKLFSVPLADEALWVRPQGRGPAHGHLPGHPARDRRHQHVLPGAAPGGRPVIRTGLDRHRELRRLGRYPGALQRRDGQDAVRVRTGTACSVALPLPPFSKAAPFSLRSVLRYKFADNCGTGSVSDCDEGDFRATTASCDAAFPAAPWTKVTTFAFCFHYLRGENTAFCVSFRCLRG